jgi:hypothetical protein
MTCNDDRPSDSAPHNQQSINQVVSHTSYKCVKYFIGPSYFRRLDGARCLSHTTICTVICNPTMVTRISSRFLHIDLFILFSDLFGVFSYLRVSVLFGLRFDLLISFVASRPHICTSYCTIFFFLPFICDRDASIQVRTRDRLENYTVVPKFSPTLTVLYFVSLRLLLCFAYAFALCLLSLGVVLMSPHAFGFRMPFHVSLLGLLSPDSKILIYNSC